MSQSCNGCDALDYKGELNEAGVCGECTSAPKTSTASELPGDARGYTWIGKNPGIDDIAAPHFGTSEWRSSMNKVLLALTPETLVSDGTGPLTMRDLALEHQASASSEMSVKMYDREAWGWACGDLVFCGYKLV